MNNYKSPKEWGPHFWYVMECIAHNYPDYPEYEDIVTTKTFYINLKNLLPCEKCKNNYKKSLYKYNIDNYLTCRSKLIQWVKVIKSDS